MEDGQKHLNFFRLAFLLKQGTRVLQQHFRDQYKSATNKDWIDGPEFGENFVATLGKSVYKSSKNIQRDLLDGGDVSAWDITLLSSILNSIPRPNNNSNTNPDDRNKWNKSKQKLKELSEVRNKQAHFAEKPLTPVEFSKLWEKATNAILYFGGDPATLEEIRTCDNIEGIQLINNDDTAYSNEENEVRARKLREDGNSVFKLGKFDRAITLYSQAINLTGLSDVEKGLLFSNRAHSYIKYLGKVTCEKEKEEKASLALEDAKSVIELRPTWWKGYYRAGQVFQFQQDFHAAETAYNQALGLDPSQGEVKRARDECRYDNKADEIQQHLDPSTAPQSLAETMEKCRLERGLNLPGGMDIKSVIKMHQEMMKSKDPKTAAMGCVFIAKLLCQGIDMPLDYKQALNLFTKAAAAGNAEGMYNLGILYLQGKGIKRDFERAIKLFEEAAEQSVDSDFIKGTKNIGVAEAQYAIGKCYNDGTGKPLDYLKAAQWYAKSSANGYPPAANNLAFLYRDGLGVEQSVDRAVQFWRLAAERGDALAMESLAWQYGQMGSLDEAQMWGDRAVQAGNINFITKKKEFDALMAHHRESGTFNFNEATKKLSEECPAMENFLGAVKSVMSNQTNSPASKVKSKNLLQDSLSAKIWKNENRIRKKASEGQKYAQTLTAAMDSFKKGFILLDGPSRMSLGPEIVHEFANCLRHTEIVCLFPMELMADLSKIINDVLVKSNPKSPAKGKGSSVNLDARICKCFLLMDSLTELGEFVRMSKLMFPEELYFQKLFCDMAGWLKKYEDGIKATDEALKLYPNDYDLLYCKAALGRLALDDEKKSFKSVKEYYLQFLKFAPPDHRKVPEAYYCLASLALRSTKDHQGPSPGLGLPEEVLDLFKKGVEAEKRLFPCFLPYDSNSKMLLQGLVSTIESLQKAPKKNIPKDTKTDTTAKSSSSKKPSPEKVEEEQEKLTKTLLSPLQRTNPHRVDTVLTHRKSFKYVFCTFEDNEFVVKNTMKPVKSQKAPMKLTSLKEITLDQMDPNVDKVYSGFVINFTVMEDSILGVFDSVHCIVSDEKGDFQRCYLYNLDQTDEKVRKSLAFGSNFSVMNPHFRLTADGGKGIRVDDPKSVFFHTNGGEEPLCRFCGTAQPQQNCARCKRAKYCSKECQVSDWTVLKHKLICREEYQKFM